jgi:hypothetical protein
MTMEQGATPEEAYNDCSGILVNLLKKVKRTASAKPPFYARVDVPHNIHELRNHWKHVVHRAEIADAERRLDAGRGSPHRASRRLQSRIGASGTASSSGCVRSPTTARTSRAHSTRSTRSATRLERYTGAEEM